MKVKKKTQEAIKEIIFLLIVTLIAIFFGLILEIWINRMPLIYLTVSFSVLIIGYSILKKGFIKKHEKVVIPLTSILFAFFMLMTFFTAYRTTLTTQKNYDLESETNKPKLTVQISTEEILWNRGPVSVECLLREDEKKSYSVDIPIRISINNWGSVNTQIYVVYWNSTCTDDGDYFDIPPNEKSLIKPGGFFSLNETISIDEGQGKTMGEIIPCDIKFIIKGPNFDDQKGKITLK